MKLSFFDSLALHKNSERIFYLILLFVLAIYCVYYVPAITDLSEHAYWLFMDERISYDGIQKIYHSRSCAEFINNISFGGDLRYGRLFWNIDAITSYIPQLIWGERGQIIATRLTQFGLLISAYFILSKTFIENKYLCALAFVVMLFLPETQYFTVEPKPEPQQIFFFSLFLYYAQKKQWLEGPYFIFLGIALGLKISFLPIAFCLLIYFIWKNRAVLFKKDSFSWKKKIVYSVSFVTLMLIVNFLVIEPAIIKTVINQKAIFLPKLINKPSLLRLFNKVEYYLTVVSLLYRVLLTFLVLSLISTGLIFMLQRVNAKLYRLLLWFLIGIIIAIPCVLFIPFNFTYLGYLLANTDPSHGADQIGINFFTWIHFLLFNEFNAPSLIVILVFILPFVILFRVIRNNNKVKILLPGIISFLAVVIIFLKTKRLWPHYMHFGIVFFIIFYLSIASYERNKVIKVFFLFPIFVLTCFIFVQSRNKLIQYSQRTVLPHFNEEENEYTLVCQFLNTEANKNAGIFWDPGLFYPDKINKVHGQARTEVFWGFFDSWSEGSDYVVLKENEDASLVDESKYKKYANYNEILKAKNDYYKWTNINNIPFFYERILPELTKFRVFKKINIIIDQL